MYRTGKRAHPKHDPHMERIPSVMVWNKKYRYNLFVLERHHMKCEYGAQSTRRTTLCNGNSV